MLFNDAVNCSDYTVLMIVKWNEYGALVKWHWQGKPKDSEINLSHCHFDHHKSQIDSTDVTIAYAQGKYSHRPLVLFVIPNHSVL